MVGSAIKRLLISDGYTNLLCPSSKELNLVSQEAVFNYFNSHKPDFVFHVAGKVGGIYANMTYRGEFLYENMMMASNVIHACHLNSVKKILFVSSGCVYPDLATNPIKEDSLLTGSLQNSHEHYAIAKIAGIKMCEAYFMQYKQNFAVIVPNNIYGPGDNYHPQNSHVMAALIAKFCKAKANGDKSVEIWGSGNQKREFVFVDDIAHGCIMLMNNDNARGIYNCGGGDNIAIKDLSNKIAEIVGFNGNLIFDTSKPEGHLEKYFDCSKLQSLGWQAKTSLQDGILMAYKSYLTLISE
jgi:GDP-L-fucose synthase